MQGNYKLPDSDHLLAYMYICSSTDGVTFMALRAILIAFHKVESIYICICNYAYAYIAYMYIHMYM